LSGYRAEGQCGNWDEVERWLDEQAPHPLPKLSPAERRR
jgi:hypothetical protein